LTNVTIGNAVMNLGDMAFHSCSLTSVIPNSVTNIGAEAFGYCGALTIVSIGNSVTSIGYYAFLGSSLTSAFFQGNAPTTVGAIIFPFTPVTVYRYQEATGWGTVFAGKPVVVVGPASTPPSILTHPQDATVSAFGSAGFNVAASGSVPLHFQWFRNNSDILNELSSTVSALTITNVRQADLGAYVVIVTNDFGSVTSSAANLYMYRFLSAPFTGVVSYWGKDTPLSIGVWGSGILNYQWYRDGIPVIGATNATLMLAGIQFSNAGSYSVIVSNALGAITNAPFQVIVNPANVSLGLFPGVKIDGTVGYTYIIQSASNLGDTNAWQTITNITLTQPSEIWNDNSTDTTLPNNPRKFYRVLPGQ
jgi:hypothetical protein